MGRLADLRARATRPRRTVPVLLDGELREQIEAVEDELDRLDDRPVQDRRLGRSRDKQLRDDLAKLRASADESSVFVVLEAMQRTPFRALLAGHPSRPDVPVDRLGYNAETFPPALAKACIIGYRERPDADAPILSDWPDPDYVAWLVDEQCSPGQVAKLFTAAMELCSGDDAVPLPRKRSETLASGAE